MNKMKCLIPFVVTLSLLSCNLNKEKQTPSSISVIKAIDIEESKLDENKFKEMDPQVAIDFLNAYIENSNQMRSSIGVVEWCKASSLATESFKIELEKIIHKARQQYPELGLGFDPLFDAQDYPEEGVELVDFNSETGYITVKGIQWESFIVTMKVVFQNDRSLVDGCGIVNIPKSQRAER